MNYRLAVSLLLGAVLTLGSGCGFTLRSNGQFPQSWQPVYIQTKEQYSDPQLALQNASTEFNIQTAPINAANSRIDIINETYEVIDIVLGEVNIKQLTMTWNYRFDVLSKSKANTPSQNSQELIISGSQSFSLEGSATDNNPDFRTLLNDLRRDLAIRLLRSINSDFQP